MAAHALLAEAAPVTLDGLAQGAPFLRLDAAALGAGRVLRNTGAAETEVVITTFGVPTEPEPASGNGYRIARALYTLDGARADPAALPLNERLVAVLIVTPERDIEARLLVSDPLPAGLESENPNLLRSGQPGQLAWLAADDVARHAEFRADRFVAAIDWSGTASFRLAYLVRAVSPGSFHQPAASVEDMYRPANRARTDAGRVEVVEAP
jgi:alpha-2-macroglobulin